MLRERVQFFLPENAPLTILPSRQEKRNEALVQQRVVDGIRWER